MNTQLNTIFSKVQMKAVIFYLLSLFLLLGACGAKIYFDVKEQKEHLIQVLLNSKALDHYATASKEIEKAIDQVKKDGIGLYKMTMLDVYYLNDHGSALYWITDGSEKSILNRSDVNSIPNELNADFKKLNFHSKQTIGKWFLIRLKPNSKLDRSIVLCIPELKLWMNIGVQSLPLTVAGIVLLTIFFFVQSSSMSYWIKKPLSKFVKHLEYESQGISSELERDVPAAWQELFMEYNLSFDKEIIHEGTEAETEEQATQRYHAQLQELRWAKEQLAKYQNQEHHEGEEESNSNEKLQGFFNTFEHAQVGVMVADAETIPIYLNHKAKDLLGKGTLPTSEEDLLDIRKIYIEDTDVEIPQDQHPMILAKETNLPHTVKHIEAYNPDTSERKKIQIFATPISAYTSMNEYYLILIAEQL